MPELLNFWSHGIFTISVDEERGGSLKNKDIDGKDLALNQKKFVFTISFVSFVLQTFWLYLIIHGNVDEFIFHSICVKYMPLSLFKFLCPSIVSEYFANDSNTVSDTFQNNVSQL